MFTLLLIFAIAVLVLLMGFLNIRMPVFISSRAFRWYKAIRRQDITLHRYRKLLMQQKKFRIVHKNFQLPLVNGLAFFPFDGPFKKSTCNAMHKEIFKADVCADPS